MSTDPTVSDADEFVTADAADVALRCRDALTALGGARIHVAGFGRDDLLAHLDAVREGLRVILAAHTTGRPVR